MTPVAAEAARPAVPGAVAVAVVVAAGAAAGGPRLRQAWPRGLAQRENPLDTGSPSTSAAYTTLPLIIILGIVIGIAGVRMRRRAEV